MRRLFAGLALWALFSGCAPARDPAPPKIRLGKETCAECRMSIDDDRFCCALLGEDGVYLKFDDIGCMKHFEETRHWASRPGWVRDSVSRGWLKKDEAYYVQAKNEWMTPMGSGIAAFQERRSAEDSAAKASAAVLPWGSIKGGKDETVH